MAIAAVLQRYSSTIEALPKRYRSDIAAAQITLITPKKMISQSTPEHVKESISKFLKKLDRLETDRRYRKIESRQKAMKRIAAAECDRLRREIGLKYLRESGIVQDIARSSDGSIATLSKYFGFYRDALKAIELSEANSYEVEVGDRGNRRLARSHICHGVFKLSAIESQSRKDQQSKAIQAKRDPRSSARTTLTIHDVNGVIATAQKLLSARSYLDLVIATAQKLLSARSYLDLAIGIQVLTGRRSYEVACTATLQATDENHAIFGGQAKGKSLAKESYEIPVLGGLAVEVVEALARLRTLKPELVGLDNATFNNRCQKELNARVARHFEGCMQFVKKGNLGRVTSHNLRAAYGRIAFEKFGKHEGYDDSDMLPYLSRVLGHAENDLISGQSYKYVNLSPAAA